MLWSTGLRLGFSIVKMIITRNCSYAFEQNVLQVSPPVLLNVIIFTIYFTLPYYENLYTFNILEKLYTKINSLFLMHYIIYSI